MADPRDVRSLDIIGAIRLAAEASTDCRTFRKVVDVLCAYAPETPGWSTGPVELLVAAVRDVNGRWSVTNDDSRIERRHAAARSGEPS